MPIHAETRVVGQSYAVHVTSDFAAYIVAHALNSLLSDELLHEHPEISAAVIDEKMFDLFNEIGLTNLLNQYRAQHSRANEEIAQLKEQLRELSRSAAMSKQMQKMLLERDKLVRELTNDRDRLIAEKNEMFVERRKRELGQTTDV